VQVPRFTRDDIGGVISIEESAVPFPDAVMSYMAGTSEAQSPVGAHS
jgi:hypothetical protein